MLCNANPKTKKTKTIKKNGHKEQKDEAQGPCHKDLIRSSLLYQNFLDATLALELLFILEC